MFGLFQGKKKSQAKNVTRTDDADEIEIATFQPVFFSMTTDLLRRQREDELRKKYCNRSVDIGELL